jgi:hypothetical protein
MIFSHLYWFMSQNFRASEKRPSEKLVNLGFDVTLGRFLKDQIPMN